MTVPIQFALLGLGAGAAYGLAALGLVLVYRGSGVINFAHGAVGMIGTFVFYELHDVRHWSFASAAVPALVVCALLGVAIQLLVMGPLQHSSGLAKLLATLGVLTTLQGLAGLRYHSGSVVVASSLPRSTVQIAGAVIGWDRLLIFALVVVLVAILFVLYRYSKFGIATAAVAENPRAAAHLGHSPTAIACANWAMGSMLAGLAGILLAPITGLSVVGLTLLVIPALAAAVVGRMLSFPVTLLAGVLIGVAQSEITRYVSSPGWANAVPFFVIIVMLSLRGTGLPTRGTESQRMPAVGLGRIRLWLLAIALAVVIGLVQVVPPEWVDGITVSIAVAIVVLSIVVVTGYAGQVSLAQWMMAGLGAWIAAKLVTSAGFSMLAALLTAVMVMIPIGVVIGLPALRSRGDQLAIVTLGVSVAIEQLIFNSPALTGGSTGLQVGFPTIFGIGVDNIVHPRSYAVVSICLFTICAVAVANLRRGRAGRGLLALRSNERAAASLGVSVTGGKLYAFAFAGMVAAVGGVVFSFRNPAVLFSDYPAFQSVTVVGYAVIGGLGFVTGPLVGSALQPGGVGTTLGNLFGEGIEQYLLVASGPLLILTVVANVDGVVASEIRRWSSVGKRITGRIRRNRPADVSVSEPAANAGTGTDAVARKATRVTEQALEISDIAVRFGATEVLRNVSLDVQPGSVVGLIGPNGAGKTTLIDVITGFVTPSHGTVKLNGEPVHRAAYQRARTGIARSYQSLELFDDMTVLENLRIAAERCRWWNYITDPIFPGHPTTSPAMAEAIEVFRLGEVLDKRPSELSYGQRRLVAIARAVASEPSVLLLDEPAAGLSEVERDELGELVTHLARERGIAILLIEHDVELVMRLCERIVALDFGQVIAQGSPAEIRENAAVIASYLGAAATEEIAIDDEIRSVRIDSQEVRS